VRHIVNHTFNQQYVFRVLASTVVTLLLLIAIVKLWPQPIPGGDEPSVYAAVDQESIQMEEIVQTRQVQQAPPPPAPLPPVVVPDDIEIEPQEFDFAETSIPTVDPGLDLEFKEGDPEGEEVQSRSTRPDTGPKPVRVVEPKYPREAEKKKIKAEINVEVLVDEKGRVKEKKITERFLVKDDDGPREATRELGYGLEEAALAAADRWLFRPARQNGKAVASYQTLTFSFGIQTDSR
jgi:protein TonB